MKKFLFVFLLAILLVPAAGAFPLAQEDDSVVNSLAAAQSNGSVGHWLLGSTSNSDGSWQLMFQATESQVMSYMGQVFDVFPVLQTLGNYTVNFYQVSFGGNPAGIHYDLFGCIDCRIETFTHVENGQTAVPEPSMVIGLLTLGIGGLIGRSRIFRRST